MNKIKKRFISFAVILMFTFLLPQIVLSQELIVIPQLSISGEYNDNILFSRVEEEDDFIYNIAPTLRLNYKAERLDLRSSATVLFRRYDSENDNDREDYDLDLRAGYLLTERLRFQGRLNYVEDFTRESRAVDLPETSLDEFIAEDPETLERGIESFYSERKRYRAYASLNHQLTEVSNLIFGYKYFKTDYDSETNTDYEVNDVNMYYTRTLKGQRDRIGTRLTYSERTSDPSDTDSFGMGLVWHHFFTETTTIYTDVGARYTEQNFNNNSQKEDNWNGTLDIKFRKYGETNVINVGISQDLNTSSSGEAVNVSRLYWDGWQALSERLLLELEGDFYITRDEDDSLTDTDITSFDIIPSLRYLLTENHSVILAYNYTIEHDSRLDSDRDNERHRIWLAFEFGFPRKW